MYNFIIILSVFYFHPFQLLLLFLSTIAAFLCSKTIRKCLFFFSLSTWKFYVFTVFVPSLNKELHPATRTKREREGDREREEKQQKEKKMWGRRKRKVTLWLHRYFLCGICFCLANLQHILWLLTCFFMFLLLPWPCCCYCCCC